MMHIIITSYNEPKATKKAVEAFLKQKTKHKFKIIVVDPFPEVEKFINKEIKDKRVDFFLDPGEGKGYALNLLLEMLYSDNKNDIIVSTDGDVHVSDNAIDEIAKAFEDKKIGVITAHPISVDNKKSKYGFWSHMLFDGINKVRKNMSKKQQFFECSGYLFAIRNSVITDFPQETSEDSIIPYLFWKKGYKIKYLPEVKVYVKNPDNWKDWKNQKIRNIKAHENLDKIAPDMPRTKSLFNEIRKGLLFTLSYPRNLKEIFWTLQLYFARLSIYLTAFKELKQKKSYSDGWRETKIESTKPLD